MSIEIRIELEQPKALLLFSGGFDSTVLLHELIAEGQQVTLVFFNYGQKNLLMEEANVDYWRKKFGLRLIKIAVPPPAWSDTSISGGSGSLYFPARNTIFLAYALSVAESYGIPEVFYGAIDGLADDAYPDTTPQYVKMFDALSHGTTGIEIFAPYVRLEKDAVKDLAEYTYKIDMQELLDHTFSCNTPDGMEPCGKCSDCEAIAHYRYEIDEES